jgi:hypothetical protein
VALLAGVLEVAAGFGDNRVLPSGTVNRPLEVRARGFRRLDRALARRASVASLATAASVSPISRASSSAWISGVRKVGFACKSDDSMS